jgi:hypothetical protein
VIGHLDLTKLRQIGLLFTIALTNILDTPNFAAAAGCECFLANLIISDRLVITFGILDKG